MTALIAGILAFQVSALPDQSRVAAIQDAMEVFHQWLQSRETVSPTRAELRQAMALAVEIRGIAENLLANANPRHRPTLEQLHEASEGLMIALERRNLDLLTESVGAIAVLLDTVLDEVY